MKVWVMKVWGGLLGCTGACAKELKSLPILFSSGPDSNYTGRAVGLRSYLNPKYSIMLGFLNLICLYNTKKAVDLRS